MRIHNTHYAVAISMAVITLLGLLNGTHAQISCTQALAGTSNLHDVDVSWGGSDKLKTKAEILNLSADALFAFDRYAQKDLLQKGRAILDKLVEILNGGYV